MYEEILNNREEILKRAWPVLVMKNDEYLKDKMHVPFLDMEIVWSIYLEEGASTMLLKKIAQGHNITEEDLMNRVPEHRVDYYWQTLGSRMRELTEELDEELDMEIIEDIGGGIIVTNRYNFKGSGCLLFTDIFETLSKVSDGDMYIIPSSIHEVLVMFADPDVFEPADVRRMVKDTNDTVVDEKERLSYNVYKYNRDANEIQIA